MKRFWGTALEVDRRLRDAEIAYCIIKSYGGNLEYNDGNVDVVVAQPLWEVYRRAFAEDFTVCRRDRIKNRLYERTKLMLTPQCDELAKLHLHSNAGWHDICFASAGRILANAVDLPIQGRAVRILDRHEEAQLFVMHIIFEQFKTNQWDVRFLTPADYTAFAEQFGLPEDQMAKVVSAEGAIPIRHLRPIWRGYYRARRSDACITLRNRLLHFGFVIVQLYRRYRSRWRRQ